MRHLRALVTGAARGLGEAIAERLVVDGATLAALDVNPGVISTVERFRARSDGPFVALVGDVADEDFVTRAVQDAVAALGGLDVVVNNAGYGGPLADLADTPVGEIRRVLDVNLLGCMLVARAAVGAMIAGGGGAIINIGSLYGQQGVAGGAAYSAAKAGLGVLTHSLALELAPHGIRVNTVAPGNMATEMHWADLRARAKREGITFAEEVERVRAQIPLGRHGSGADVAGAVAWLVSNDASYVTGQTIGVNGGVLFI
jgi:NAD(P)-dependent dehydrogenase (short-subunit alcohol dehydrogenase family)